MKSRAKNRGLGFLVLRAQAGDVEAFDRLLQSFQPQLFGFLSHILQDTQLSEDALQSTFMLIHRKLKWLREPTLFKSWAFRIASREALRLAKIRRGVSELTNLEGLEQLISPSAPIDVSNSTTDVDLVLKIPEWLERLSHKGREVLVLHYLEEFSTPDIAEILGIPLGTVKSRINYALTCIRKHTSEHNN